MLSYVFKRLLMVIPTMLVVTMIVFTIVRLVPGDPVLLMMGDVKNPELVEQMREQLGFNKPIPLQYADWLAQLLRLDFGTSYVTGQAVLPTMLDHFGVTLQVVVIAVFLATCIAVVGGMLAAWHHNRATDNAIVMLAILCMSIPSFWLGIAFILIFGVALQWLPTVGYVSPLQDPWTSVEFLILPIAALVLAEAGGIMRMVRSSTLDVIKMEYVTHARAKGLRERTIMSRHVFKNMFGPVLTLVGFIVGSLLGGAAVIETVFTLPGLGRLLVTSIFSRDYAMVQGIMVLVSFSYILINLTVDLLYPIFDPRVRL